MTGTITNPNYTGSATNTLTITAIPPQAQTLATTQIGAQTATFNASVIPEGLQTSVTFQYTAGTSTTTLTTTPTTVTGATMAVPVHVNVTGLLPSTLYHVTVVATSTGGTSNAKTLTFTTLPMPQFTPQTALLSATGVQVSFGVTTGGVATSVYFIYGTDPNNLNMQSQVFSIGSSKSELFPSAFLSGLEPGMTYTYEIVTVSAAGSFPSAPQTFTTLGFDTSIVAKKGDTANGSGGTYTAFSSPAINTSDGVAFEAQVAGVGSAGSLGIWANQGTDTLELIAQTAVAAPDTSATFSGFVDFPIYNNANAVAFGATLRLLRVKRQTRPPRASGRRAPARCGWWRARVIRPTAARHSSSSVRWA